MMALLHVILKGHTDEHNIYLIDEPELFLHPWQTLRSKIDLREKSKTNQVFIATHSPEFIAKDFDLWKNIYKIYRKDKLTQCHSIDSDKITSIFKSAESDYELYLIKYCTYLNAENSKLFFCDKVIITEGPTEKCFIEKLYDDGKIVGRDFYVFSCDSKSNIPHAFQLCQQLGFNDLEIFIIYDHDKKKGDRQHLEWNSNISNLHIQEGNFIAFTDDMEAHFSVPKPPKKQNHLKPAWFLKHYLNSDMDLEKRDEFIEKINIFLKQY